MTPAEHELVDEVASRGYARIGVGIDNAERWLTAKELMQKGLIDLLRLPSGALLAVRPEVAMATRLAAI